MTTPDQSAPPPSPPVSGAPQPHVADPQIPQMDIPHMGTSHAPDAQGTPQRPSPEQPQQGQRNGSASTSNGAPAHPGSDVRLPPLPDGVTQTDVDAAILKVEQTGQTDGIDPKTLTAACAQIEAHAAHHGIALDQNHQDQGPPTVGPANYVEAAVMDKQATFDNFNQQRDSLKEAVAEQRDAARKPYREALDKSGSGSTGAAFDPEAVEALARAIRELDPETVQLINAMGVLQSTPGILKGIVWMEIIRAMRALIATETKTQVDQHFDSQAV